MITRKEVKPIRFLYYSTETTVDELSKYLWVGQSLIKEAVKYDLKITGPVHWHYHSFVGDLKKPFRLEVCLPVASVISEYDGDFHFKVTDLFTCISIIHSGNWLEIPSSYARLMTYLQEHGLTPIGVNRELYINVDLNTPAANVTEIQFGVS